jgi:hypothetical protein
MKARLRIHCHGLLLSIVKFIHLLYVNRTALLSGNFLVSNSDTSDLRIDSFLWASCGFCGFVAERNDSCMTGIHVEILVDILQRSVGGLWVQEVDDWDKE